MPKRHEEESQEMEKRTKAQWQEVLEAQRKSGKTQKAWCAENGVNYQTFASQSSNNGKKRKSSDLAEAAGRGGTAAETQTKSRAQSTEWVEAAGPEVTAAGMWRKATAQTRKYSETDAEGVRIEIGAFRLTNIKDMSDAELVRLLRALAGVYAEL